MKKKQIGLLVGIAVLAMVGMGLTLAFLHTTTETKTNTFSSNKYLSIQLREPAWDGYTFNDEGEPNGKTAKPGVTTDPDNKKNPLGVIEAAAYVPGETIYKNPMVKNNGNANDGVSAYVALKVEYYDSDNQQVSYEEFANAYLAEKGLNFDTKNWTKISTKNNGNAQIFLYTASGAAASLAVNAQTPALFTQVPLSMDIEPDAKTGLLPAFNIKVQAYAIQSPGIEADKAADTLLTYIAQN